MGQTTSRQYPDQLDVVSGTYGFTEPVTPAAALAVPGSNANTQNFFALRKKQIQTLFKKMKSNLEMYMLYDNYDSKNKVILIDLKKKAENQEKELKKTLESRDKLMAEFQTTKDNTELYKSKDSNTEIINTILFLLLIGTIVFIIYKIYTYPMDSKNNNNNNSVNINNLIDLNSSNLNNLSENDLNQLEKAFDTKINQLETSINNINNSNSANNSLKNTISNSVNNITNTNLKKRNKLTLN